MNHLDGTVAERKLHSHDAPKSTEKQYTLRLALSASKGVRRRREQAW